MYIYIGSYVAVIFGSETYLVHCLGDISGGLAPWNVTYQPCGDLTGHCALVMWLIRGFLFFQQTILYWSSVII